MGIRFFLILGVLCGIYTIHASETSKTIKATFRKHITAGDIQSVREFLVRRKVVVRAHGISKYLFKQPLMVALASRHEHAVAIASVLIRYGASLDVPFFVAKNKEQISIRNYIETTDARKLGAVPYKVHLNNLLVVVYKDIAPAK